HLRGSMTGARNPIGVSNLNGVSKSDARRNWRVVRPSGDRPVERRRRRSWALLRSPSPRNYVPPPWPGTARRRRPAAPPRRPRRAAEHVVAALEMIYVDHHHAERLVAAPSAALFAIQRLLEVAAVVKAGQRVAHSPVVQAEVCLCQLPFRP